MNNIIEMIKGLIKTNQKYNIDLHARSIAYYMVASISSLIIITIEVLNKYSTIFSSSVMIEILQVFFDTFSDLIGNLISSIQISGFSVVLLFTIIYSAARIINGFNKFSYEIYGVKRYRNNFIGLINSGMMFIILLLTIITELFIAIFGKYLIGYIIKSIFLIKLIEFVLELLVFFISITILYLYVPPENVNIKKVFKGSLFSTLSIYVILEVFLILFNVLYKMNEIVGIAFVFSMFTFFNFFIYYILLYGLVINYNNKIVV